MANNIIKIRKALALALALALMTPVAIYANDKKHFKDGLKYEENRQWDKAAEQYALAVAEKPSNIEYQLHLQRALVSAAIMLVERGDRLAEQKDYQSAYEAYRQAYAFDNTNELALIKMRRMLEAQGLPTKDIPKGGDPAGPRYKLDPDPNEKKASYTTTQNPNSPFSRVVGVVPAQLQLPG